MLLPLIIALSLFAGSPLRMVTIYVSPRGNDQSTGNSANPLATVQAAIARARTAAHAGGARIVVRGGTYMLPAPIVLGPDDSGLTIQAAPQQRPKLIAGVRLAWWRRDGGRFWSAELPPHVSADFRLLVVNDSLRPRARLPESGTFTHLSRFDVPWMSTTGGGWKRKPTERELTTMQYRQGDLGPWLDVRSAEVTVYHQWDESCVGVKTIDPATNTITFSAPCGHPPGAFGIRQYVVWNVREGMHGPGQWFVDREAHKVVYWPRPGETMAHMVAYVPTAEAAIDVRGTPDHPVEGVRLHGVEIAVTNTPLKAGGFGTEAYEGAITLSNTRDCRVEDVAVHNVAGWGIRAHASPGLSVERCQVSDAGAGGIGVDGADARVEDCLVQRVGRLYASAIGVWIEGPRVLLAHNEIHDTPYTAVAGAGDDSRIEHNLIYRAMTQLRDGGGIYVTFCKRVTLRGNVVRDIPDAAGPGSSAYYLDEQAEDCLVEDNISLGVSRPSHNHMARRNTLRNNLFIVNGDAKLTFPKCVDYILDHNVVYAAGNVLIQAPPDADLGARHTVLYSVAGRVERQALRDYSPGAIAPIQSGAGFDLTDPGLVDPLHGDLRFRSGSPASTAGVRPLSLSQAGLRSTRGGTTRRSMRSTRVAPL